jgi:WD repeat-containing protein mio
VISAAGGVERKTDADRKLYRVPSHITDSPHVFLRCNFCSSSLPVDSMLKQQHAQWLRRQKPLINCCPSCKKPLPRCYVCLLYVSMINPQVEYNLAAQRLRRANDAAAAAATATDHEDEPVTGVSESTEEHSILGFGQWFTFCQKCKHGGHAGCLEKWFTGNTQQVQKFPIYLL